MHKRTHHERRTPWSAFRRAPKARTLDVQKQTHYERRPSEVPQRLGEDPCAAELHKRTHECGGRGELIQS